MQSRRPKFRYPDGSFILKELFFGASAVYSLTEDPTGKLPWLKTLYVECGDPTELKFANKYFDGLEHWKAICECPWFIPYLTAWRSELDLAIVSKVFDAIKEEAEGNTQSSFQANKLLLTLGWRDAISKARKTDESNKGAEIEASRGRPSNAQILKAAHEIASEKLRVDADAKRILGGTEPSVTDRDYRPKAPVLN